MPEVNRKERKRKAERKRRRIAQKILEKIKHEYEQSKDWERALRAGEEYGQSMIRRKPQDTTLIVDAFHKVANALTASLEEVVGRKSAGKPTGVFRDKGE